jgi:hypothetical protein
MIQGIQTFFEEAGKAACYALSIVNIAEEVLGRQVDACTALLEGVAKGFIRYAPFEDPDNFFVDRPAEFLEYLTGQKWTVRKEAAGYRPAQGEYVVMRYERQATGMTIGHFRRPGWDSLVTSKCVREGKLVSLRVFAKA